MIDPQKILTFSCEYEIYSFECHRKMETVFMLTGFDENYALPNVRHENYGNDILGTYWYNRTSLTLGGVCEGEKFDHNSCLTVELLFQKKGKGIKKTARMPFAAGIIPLVDVFHHCQLQRKDWSKPYVPIVIPIPLMSVDYDYLRAGKDDDTMICGIIKLYLYPSRMFKDGTGSIRDFNIKSWFTELDPDTDNRLYYMPQELARIDQKLQWYPLFRPVIRKLYHEGLNRRVVASSMSESGKARMAHGVGMTLFTPPEIFALFRQNGGANIEFFEHSFAIALDWYGIDMNEFFHNVQHLEKCGAQEINTVLEIIVRAMSLCAIIVPYRKDYTFNFDIISKIQRVINESNTFANLRKFNIRDPFDILAVIETIRKAGKDALHEFVFLMEKDAEMYVKKNVQDYFLLASRYNTSDCEDRAFDIIATINAFRAINFSEATEMPQLQYVQNFLNIVYAECYTNVQLVDSGDIATFYQNPSSFTMPITPVNHMVATLIRVDYFFDCRNRDNLSPVPLESNVYQEHFLPVYQQYKKLFDKMPRILFLEGTFLNSPFINSDAGMEQFSSASIEKYQHVMETVHNNDANDFQLFLPPYHKIVPADMQIPVKEEIPKTQSQISTSGPSDLSPVVRTLPPFSMHRLTPVGTNQLYEPHMNFDSSASSYDIDYMPKKPPLPTTSQNGVLQLPRHNAMNENIVYTQINGLVTSFFYRNFNIPISTVHCFDTKSNGERYGVSIQKIVATNDVAFTHLFVCGESDMQSFHVAASLLPGNPFRAAPPKQYRDELMSQLKNSNKTPNNEHILGILAAGSEDDIYQSTLRILKMKTAKVTPTFVTAAQPLATFSVC